MAGSASRWNPIQLALVCFYVFGYYNLALSPYIIYRHASVTFWVSFALFLWFVIVPVMLLLTNMGAKTERGIVGIISTGFPLMKGAGVSLLVLQLLQNLTFSYLFGITLHYMFDSLSSPYPWVRCDYPWSTDCCGQGDYDSSDVDTSDYPYANYTDFSLPCFEPSDLENRVLQFTTGDGGSEVPWNTAIPVFAVWVIVFLSSMGGAGFFGMIMYVVGPLYALLYFIVLIYSRTLPIPEGVTDTAMDFFYVLKTDTAVNPEEVIRAMLHLIFTLGIFSGILPTLGKYTGRRCRQYKGLFYSFWVFLFIYVIIAPHAAIGVWAPYIGGLAYKKGVTIGNVMTGGPSFLFELIPNAIAALDVPNGMAFLIYALAFLSGIIQLTLSTVVILDNIEEGLGERTKSRPVLWRIVSSLVLCTLSFLFSLMFCARNGYNTFQLMDYAIVHWMFLIILTFGIAVSISFFLLKYHVITKVCLGICFLLAILAMTVIHIFSLISSISFLDYMDTNVNANSSVISWVLGFLVWIVCLYAGVFHTIVASGGFNLKQICCPSLHDANEAPSANVQMTPLVETQQDGGQPEKSHV